ncbi:MAG: hypothetical protein BGO29_13620 [Bacteroidales bacterium 36-12]|nr:MAG: hypothetical protein BGO29_13620 [Bacteroidales bacterium 36-12]
MYIYKNTKIKFKRMKKMLLINILMLTSLLVMAQSITIEKTYSIDVQSGFHPQFNSDGTMLAFSGDSYVGLNVYKLANKSVIKITEDAGAGFQPVFSKSNDKIFYKNIVYQERLRNEGVKSYEFATKKDLVLLAPQRNVRQPQSYENGIVVHANNKLLKATIGKTQAPVPDYVWSDGSNLFIYRNNKIQKLNPIEGANGYIWASLSPDGKSILFTAAGEGAYVCDLDGKITAKLGYLNAPTWYDNNFVVGMQDKDNGDYVTESKIIMKSVDGKTEKVLSDPKQISMYPTASSKAGKVAFNAIDGKIFIVEVRVK